MKELKWNWAGHFQRHDDTRWPKLIEKWEPKGKRSKGRPQTRWKDDIEIQGSFLWRRKAKNRELWKRLGNTFELLQV